MPKKKSKKKRSSTNVHKPQTLEPKRSAAPEADPEEGKIAIVIHLSSREAKEFSRNLAGCRKNAIRGGGGYSTFIGFRGPDGAPYKVQFEVNP